MSDLLRTIQANQDAAAFIGFFSGVVIIAVCMTIVEIAKIWRRHD